MFEPKIKIRKALLEKLTAAAAQLGTTVEELCDKVLEREVEKLLSTSSGNQVSDAEVAKITSKLKGLGYLE